MNTKKNLVIVDMQNDFVSGVLGGENQKVIVPNVVMLAKEFINEGCNIFYTLDSHTKDSYNLSREGKYLPVQHCIIGTEGHKLIPELEFITKVPNAQAIYKLDSFGVWNLHQYFTASTGMNYDPWGNYEFYFCGLVTNMCVLSTAMSFQNMFRRSDIYIYKDACASFDENLHNKTLDIMKELQMIII